MHKKRYLLFLIYQVENYEELEPLKEDAEEEQEASC